MVIITLFFAVYLHFPVLQTQYSHAFYVPRQADQTPFSLNLTQAAQGELPESHHGFDNPEDRFYRLFAQLRLETVGMRVGSILGIQNASMNRGKVLRAVESASSTASFQKALAEQKLSLEVNRRNGPGG